MELLWRGLLAVGNVRLFRRAKSGNKEVFIRFFWSFDKTIPPGASTSFFLTGCIIFALETGWIAFGLAADSGLLALINSVINFF